MIASKAWRELMSTGGLDTIEAVCGCLLFAGFDFGPKISEKQHGKHQTPQVNEGNGDVTQTDWRIVRVKVSWLTKLTDQANTLMSRPLQPARLAA
jgi:hypothetical protein